MKKLVIAAVLAIVVYQVWTKDLLVGTPRNVAEGAVILYATDWCGYCRQTRTFLADKGIPYTEFDIEKSEEGRRQYDALGVRGVPVLNVNGKIIKGYDPKEILAALRAK